MELGKNIIDNSNFETNFLINLLLSNKQVCIFIDPWNFIYNFLLVCIKSKKSEKVLKWHHQADFSINFLVH